MIAVKNYSTPGKHSRVRRYEIAVQNVRRLKALSEFHRGAYAPMPEVAALTRIGEYSHLRHQRESAIAGPYSQASVEGPEKVVLGIVQEIETCRGKVDIQEPGRRKGQEQGRVQLPAFSFVHMFTEHEAHGHAHGQDVLDDSVLETHIDVVVSPVIGIVVIMRFYPFVARLEFQSISQADGTPRAELGGYPTRLPVIAEADNGGGGADGISSRVQGSGSLERGVDVTSLRP